MAVWRGGEVWGCGVEVRCGGVECVRYEECGVCVRCVECV